MYQTLQNLESKKSIYDIKLQQLFESEQENQMVFMQQATDVLSVYKRALDKTIIERIIDPTTGNPYEGGIILEGEFASMDVLNNNNRYYREENYLQFVEILKHQIFSKRGLYGELEHPKSYAVDYNNVSHKILDIWYDKLTKKVRGIVLVLATPNGLKAQQIIKSGGQLAISARGGGEAIKNADGSITAMLTLLTTFDLVCQPGFSSAVLDYNVKLNASNLNESAVMIYQKDMHKLPELFENFSRQLHNTSFIEFLHESTVNITHSGTVNFFESEQQTQQAQQQTMQRGDVQQKNDAEQQLQDAVQQTQLKENERDQAHQQYFMQTATQLEKRRLAGALYDGSAGFIASDSTNFNENNKRK